MNKMGDEHFAGHCGAGEPLGGDVAKPAACRLRTPIR